MARIPVEALYSIDVNALWREKLIELNENHQGNITCRIHGDDDRRFEVRSFLGQTVEISYWRWTLGERKTITIPLAWTACTYGNQRPWFICPRCKGRKGKLYFRNGEFNCRGCLGLCYESQREPLNLRGIKLACKLRSKLADMAGGEEDVKPPRMHWKTYNRIMARADAAFERSPWPSYCQDVLFDFSQFS